MKGYFLKNLQNSINIDKLRILIKIVKGKIYMNNKKTIYISIILCVIFSIITGIGTYKYNKRKTISNSIIIKQLSDSGEAVDKEIIDTSSQEIRVNPTAIIKMKQYYKKCGHTTENEFSVPEDIINMNQKQVEKYYFGWHVDSFSSSEIIVSKENRGICDEHYIIRDVDGLVNVYCIKDNNSESLVYSTQIETKYLPKEDNEKLKQGISIVGKENLSSLLEDYE